MRVSYHPDYFVALPEGHPFPMAKFPELHDVLLEGDWITPGDVMPMEEASRELLGLVHEREYLDRLFDFSLPPQEERKMGLPWTPQLLRRSRLAVSGTLNAAHAALADGMAGNLGGGTHHAMPDHGRGFCIFNDVAIALRHLLNAGAIRRALVLDCDVHQGDGTAKIFANDPRVFTFSMHGDRNYPARKPPSTVDVPLPAGTSDGDYLHTLRKYLPEVLRRAEADLVVYLGGVDVHADSTFGHFALTDAGIRRRDHLVIQSVRARGLPLLLTLSGGYATTARRTAELHAIMYEEAITLERRQQAAADNSKRDRQSA